MKLIVARHGQTAWNSEERVCGISDIELTDHGCVQAMELAAALADQGIDVILSSPLKRAVRTATIIAETLGIDVVYDERLTEQNYGIYEGTLRHSADFKEAKKHFASRFSGGESLFQIAQRIYNFLDELREGDISRNILIITHGSVCRVIHSYFNDLTNEQYSEYYTRNGEYSLFSI